MPDKSAPTDFPLILDAHCHLGYFRNFHIPDAQIEGFVVNLDRVGIDIAVLSSHMAISSDTPRGNDLVIDAMKRYPDRILGHCTVNPNYPNDVERELERCFSVPGFRSIKLHPELHGHYPLEGEGYRRMWEFANDRHLPVLSHTHFAGDGLDVFARLAERYRAVTILLGHAGFDLGIEGVIRLLETHDNIVLDLTGPLFFEGFVDYLVSELGADRLLFSSDSPFVNPALQLGGVVGARISREEKRKILGLNAASIFDVDAEAFV